jgi:hypothetical protein
VQNTSRNKRIKKIGRAPVAAIWLSGRFLKMKENKNSDVMLTPEEQKCLVAKVSREYVFNVKRLTYCFISEL